MTAETDLLPCPGCNGTNTRVIGGPGTRGGPEHWAGCDQCRWRTWGNTEAEAIAAWNRRACVSSATEALRADNDALRIAKDAANRMLLAELSRNQRLEAETERLAEALLRYGVHEQACLDDDVQWCTCGFQDIRDDAARAALEQETTNG